MLAVEHLILRGNFGFPKLAYFWILLTLTMIGTIGFSMVLFRYIEAPGIRLGRKLAARFQKSAGGIPVAA